MEACSDGDYSQVSNIFSTLNFTIGSYWPSDSFMIKELLKT